MFGRVRPLVLAALLLAASPALAQLDDWDDDDGREDQRGRLSLTAWGGNAWDTGGDGRSHGILGGEVAWSFGGLDVGVAGYGYDGLRARDSGRDPVVLARLTQRFQTYRGLDAGVTLGVGAAREEDWKPWFQFAVGLQLDLGPLFLAGEFGFEQDDLLRLAGGIGVRLF